jgi:hypothetical protein
MEIFNWLALGFLLKFAESVAEKLAGKIFGSGRRGRVKRKRRKSLEK